MNIRRSTQVRSIVALVALVAPVGCGGTPQDEPTGGESSAILRVPPPPPYWSNGPSPDAIVTGRDEGGAPENSCRVSYNGGLIPGHMQSGWTFCEIGDTGQLGIVSPYQVLIAEWQAASNGTIPSTAFPAAWSGSAYTYACRATVGSSTQVGVTGVGYGGCVIAGGGLALPYSSYQVLIASSGFAMTTAAVTAGGAPPYNAIRGGTDANGAAEYPCSVFYAAAGRTVQGKTEAGWGYCDIASGAAEVQVTGVPYDVLVPSFVPSYGFPRYVTAFVAGTETGGAQLGICQASYNGMIQAGKYNLSDGVCSFGYGMAGEVVSNAYTVFGVSN